MAELCPMTELHPAACGHCIDARAHTAGLPVLDEPVKPSRSAPFAARYDGICGSCEFDVRAGEQVVYVDDALRHRSCA